MSTPGEVVVHQDVVNEQVVLAAAMANADDRRALVRRLVPDNFVDEKHRAAWEAVLEVTRRSLEWDLATVQALFGERIDAGYLGALAAARPSRATNLDHHVELLLWDAQRIASVRGPIAQLLEAVRDPRTEPERVRALGRQVSDSLSGDGAGCRHLRDPDQLVAEQVRDLEERMRGRAVYPFGIPGLDCREDGAPRLVPGAAPGKVTVITGLSGSGKSTFAAECVLQQARAKRRVLFGAWEPGDGMSLELLACKSLRMSRLALMTGKFMSDDVDRLRVTMRAISKRVRFLENPFWRQRGEKSSNERNLDLVHQAIADTGADVAVFDLWERCLVDDEPGAEKRALFRQQAMAEETRCHVVLLAQQRLKDLETRADKRPTREGIKGSGAWVEVADTILGTHRPALFKDIPDDTLEVVVLKQRFAPWPMAVELDWDPDLGAVSGGRTVRYDRPDEAADVPLVTIPRGRK